MIEAKKVFEAFQEHRGDAIVSVQGTSGKHWSDITTNINRDISLGGAMGQSTSAIFGLALGLPDQKVVHFDTEGALLMNLGVLASVAGKQPENFVHFLLDNGCYATTGGQPVPNSEEIDYAVIAEGSGYAATYNFDDLEELSTSLNEIMNEKGPIFVAIKVEAEVENLPIGLRERRQTRNRAQTITDLRQELGIS
ncbi:MAG: thiamine pyrophosphate-dependent enzyme [Chloroflexota bacterium]|jgi:phosphonopyruvate decarboxylase|nr:thiamine pyrophosphate-dependent enzyme [SAR202 cluster bacterium]MEC9320966.1 thiamine pyrophosphate-dependent enzyme [Chloroflexota bacterium]|tara:strand:- start:860 stop:1444 length:585 start_codon:yes stop_codon:yes gene_type:complete